MVIGDGDGFKGIFRTFYGDFGAPRWKCSNAL